MSGLHACVCCSFPVCSEAKPEASLNPGEGETGTELPITTILHKQELKV